MAGLMDPFEHMGLRLRNRIVMSPMCQYKVSEQDGTPNDWHFVHYVSRAVGGTGLIVIEMTDVHPDGRITDYDLGLWSESQVPQFRRIVDACHQFGAKVAIQIAHAGRKAQHVDEPVAPSPIAHSDQLPQPHELTISEIRDVVEAFRNSVRLAVEAGVDAIEIQAAHGYLLHQFQSAYANHRRDRYGEDKSRFGTEVIRAARDVMPDDMPLILRLSAMEYTDGGYSIDYGVALARAYKDAGADIFDVSSGGEDPKTGHRKPDGTPGFQVNLATAIKNALGVPVITVGRMENCEMADEVVLSGKADLVAVGRGMLRNPYWANEASLRLRQEPITPKAYQRAYEIV